MNQSADRTYYNLVAAIYTQLISKKNAINAIPLALGANTSKIQNCDPDLEFGNLPTFLWKALSYFSNHEQSYSIPKLKTDLSSVTQELANVMLNLEKIDVSVHIAKATVLLQQADKLLVQQTQITAHMQSIEMYCKNRKDKISVYDKIKEACTISKGFNHTQLAAEFANVYQERHREIIKTEHSVSKTKIVCTAIVVPASVPDPSSVSVSVPDPSSVYVSVSDPRSVPPVHVVVKKSNPLALLMGKTIGHK